MDSKTRKMIKKCISSIDHEITWYLKIDFFGCSISGKAKTPEKAYELVIRYLIDKIVLEDWSYDKPTNDGATIIRIRRLDLKHTARTCTASAEVFVKDGNVATWVNRTCKASNGIDAIKGLH